MRMKSGGRDAVGIPWLFVGLTHAISWALWILVILSGRDPKGSWLVVPYILGGFSPSVVGVLLLYRTRPVAERLLFWKSLVGFGRISARWYLFILLVIPASSALGILFDSLLAGQAPDFTTLKRVADDPLQIVQALVVALFFGSLSEELGWRGYALDRLRARWNALVASLVLGLVWFSWHLPLFFVHGTTQEGWGIGSIGFFGFLLSILALSVMTTWIYLGNGRSLLSAVLIHSVYNLVINLVPPSGRGFLIQGAIMALGAIFLVLNTGTNGPAARQA
jgi:membrane protease YdiL (CAAX protease family)